MEPIQTSDVVPKPDLIPGRLGRRARRQASNQSQGEGTLCVHLRL